MQTYPFNGTGPLNVDQGSVIFGSAMYQGSSDGYSGSVTAVDATTITITWTRSASGLFTNPTGYFLWKAQY